MNWGYYLGTLLFAFAFSSVGQARVNVSMVSTIKGSVRVQSECRGEDVQVWLVQNRFALFQLTVPDGGTFSMQVIPGRYTIQAATRAGCLTEENFEVQLGQKIHQMEIDVSSTRKNPRKPSSDTCTDCLVWQRGSPSTLTPISLPPNFKGPWWSTFNQFSFSNSDYPCAWNLWACSGAMYPGRGGGIATKPSLYLSQSLDKRDTKLNVGVEVKAASDSQILATVPESQSGVSWKVQLDGGKLLEGGSALSNLFYGFRFDLSKAQSSHGFCVDKDSLMERLTTILRARGFQAQEINEFSKYWSYKMPKAENFCVFPQESRHLNAMADLSIHPQPSEIIRLMFLVIPQSNLPKVAESSIYFKFLRHPEFLWVPTASSERTPASPGLTARECGVAFLASP